MSDLVRTDMLMVASRPKRFVFISDLHFDCCRLPLTSDEESVEDEQSLEREDFFIEFVKEHYANDILILAGDYYTDYERSLAFVKKLETAEITCYFVLGNHDYASDNRTTFLQIRNLFDFETSAHEHCKLLLTGKKYYHEDVCIIGDTGWNLSSNNKKPRRGNYSINHFKNSLFEAEGKKWIKFATDVLAQEKKVLIVNHFPQAVFPQPEFDFCDIGWSEATLLLEPTLCWKIFGHTHQRGLFRYENNVCSQQGYKMRRINPDYRVFDKSEFGMLEKSIPIALTK